MISVILPLYNAVDTLRRSVLSILHQSFSGLELLLVDDGSTDGSLALCHSLAAQDSRIRVLSQPHLGTGAARQLGLSSSIGEYVIHVDADDWIEPEMFARMYDLAKAQDADMVACQIRKENGRDSFLWYSESPFTSPDLPILLMEGRVVGSLCNKLIRRSICQGIPFDTDLRYLEDVMWLIRLVTDRPSGQSAIPPLNISFIDQPFYHYNISAPSITRHADRRTCDNRFLALQHIEDFYLEQLAQQYDVSCQRRFVSALSRQRLVALTTARRSGYYSRHELSKIEKGIPFSFISRQDKLHYFIIKTLCALSPSRQLLNWLSDGNY